MEGIWKEALVDYQGTIPAFPGRTNLIPDNQCPGQDSKQAPLLYSIKCFCTLLSLLRILAMMYIKIMHAGKVMPASPPIRFNLRTVR
jgi:hypothetical protein